ncbi:MAG TPA: hypothetical protein PLU79_19715, partial [Burkholderiaceae bacterium]|nr:hypothetical protein [Burkholderiaceae bacterium]
APIIRMLNALLTQAAKDGRRFDPGHSPAAQRRAPEWPGPIDAAADPQADQVTQLAGLATGRR